MLFFRCISAAMMLSVQSMMPRSSPFATLPHCRDCTTRGAILGARGDQKWSERSLLGVRSGLAGWLFVLIRATVARVPTSPL